MQTKNTNTYTRFDENDTHSQLNENTHTHTKHLQNDAHSQTHIHKHAQTQIRTLKHKHIH